jgi:hypothetical protein
MCGIEYADTPVYGDDVRQMQAGSRSTATPLQQS